MTSLPTPPLAMRYWTASFTMPTASSSKATVYAVTPTKRKSHDRLAPDRPAGPQAPPARVAPSLVGHSAPRTGPSHGPPGRSSDQPASLDQETISGTHKSVSRV